MHGPDLEASVLADGGYEGHGLDPGFSILDSDAVIAPRPGPFSEGVEGKDGLVDPHKLLVTEAGRFHGMEHVGEESHILRVVKV
ncbi:MAG: hypothetical protein ACK56F_28790, partial [bacterium]